ncbi:hypothetical protein HBI32_012040 [Parastagonospora nodorum]|nr:hypothetical protein HBI32_012040 [Parastagonospora nodorum]
MLIGRMMSPCAPTTIHQCELVPGIYDELRSFPGTYDHRALNTRLPVRSAIFKQRTGGLVVRWVTTGESPLLYVFDLFLLFHSRMILPLVDHLGRL